MPLGYRLYLPEDRARCRKAGVPGVMEFQTKVQIARQQIEGALTDDIPRDIVLADAGYGAESEFRN